MTATSEGDHSVAACRSAHGPAGEAITGLGRAVQAAAEVVGREARRP